MELNEADLKDEPTEEQKDEVQEEPVVIRRARAETLEKLSQPRHTSPAIAAAAFTKVNKRVVLELSKGNAV